MEILCRMIVTLPSKYTLSFSVYSNGDVFLDTGQHIFKHIW